MSERVNSFAWTVFASIFASFGTLAIDFDNLAMAGDTCIEKPPPPVAESVPSNVPHNDAICRSCYYTTEVLLWDVRYDRAKGRTCWFLRDAYGRDVTETHVRSRAAPTPTSTLSSKLASWFGNLNLMEASANTAPESDAAHVSPPDPSRQHQGHTANEKTNSGARTGQRSSSEAQAAKRVSQASIHRGERALFEEFREFQEFLRWRERQKMFGN